MTTTVTYEPHELPTTLTGFTPQQPKPATPTLWLVDIERHREAAARLAPDLLDAHEHERVTRFFHDQDRDLYRTSHVALRLLLAAHLALPPAEIPFTRLPCPGCGDPHGRPAVTGAAVHHSLSHTGGLAVIALATTPVGVDVERLPSIDTVTTTARSLHPRETTELAATPPAEAPAAFARAWTRKEAYLKGLGIGLGRDPSLDYVGTGPAPTALPGWTITDVHVPTGYTAAVAVAHP
ncbi:4'-phosphopantetheinyl transferase superfamily protein [Streptomyces sp. JJ66]|uniref:4'-phosphopantetheinyl transferase family protein n=1 Tax=Streptomyces sp. JJ66 TaxID=2803843 RepID=UPI001C58E19E|nr:4'-phosphopantetheinyl transferase superfamily protein [Streptomyces sp. JJ66]MBW1604377.1 4'-phosphopantetheinyl transferase superfamily protein [Streptomyces sp. JJ66]